MRSLSRQPHRRTSDRCATWRRRRRRRRLSLVAAISPRRAPTQWGARGRLVAFAQGLCWAPLRLPIGSVCLSAARTERRERRVFPPEGRVSPSARRGRPILSPFGGASLRGFERESDGGMWRGSLERVRGGCLSGVERVLWRPRRAFCWQREREGGPPRVGRPSPSNRFAL